MNGSFNQPRAFQAGFTLLEILVVMVLIAIVSGTAMLSITGGPHLQLEEAAQQLRSALQLAADEALFESSQTGALFTQDSYQFLRYDTVTRQWHAFTEKPLRTTHLPDALQLSLNMENTAIKLTTADKLQERLNPAVIFLSSGEMTPFTLTVTSSVEKESITLHTDGISPISIERSAGEK